MWLYGFIDYLKTFSAYSLVILSLMPSQPLASVILTDNLEVKETTRCLSAVINFVKKSEMTKNGNVLLQMTKIFDWFFNEISNSYFKTMLICFIAFNLLFVNPTIFVNFFYCLTCHLFFFLLSVVTLYSEVWLNSGLDDF